jgi:hypothetical protein
MTDQWTERLSEYVDGLLEPDARAALDEHLAGCAECRDVLADLRRVTERARALEDRPPERDLWPGVAERIGATPATPGLRPGSVRRPAWLRRRVSFTMPQLAAAAVVLMVLTGALATRLGDGGGPERTDTAEARPIGPRVVPVSTPRLDAAVAELELAVREGRGRLDSLTVRVIEKNLAIIDSAIVEAYMALERDPNNAFLNRHLTNQKLRKLELLRRASELAAQT